MSIDIVSRRRPTTLLEVVEDIDQHRELPLRRRQDLASACRTIGRIIGLSLGEIVADPAELTRRLKQLPGTPSGMSNGHWRNTLSRCRAALTLCGAANGGKRSKAPMSVEWAGLISKLKGSHWRFKMTRLGRYCSSLEISPLEVCDEVSAGYGRWLLGSTVERPKQIHRETCLSWNQAATAIEGWPQRTLSVPSNKKTYSLPLTAFTAAYQADVEAYLTHLAADDPFSELARKPASVVTLRMRRLQLCQLASTLVLAGRDIQSITGLKDLVELEAAKTALRFVHARSGNRKTGQVHNLALLLIGVAKHWVKSPAPQLAAIQALRKKVDPGKQGMTSRNRARLRAFDDEVNVRRLMDAPAVMLRKVSRTRPPSYLDALLVQSALGIALELCAPIRAKNLAGLRLDQHFKRTRAGQNPVVHLVLPAGEVKNKVPLEFGLPSHVATLLDDYVGRFRLLLTKEPQGFLFPARKGGAKTPSALAAQLQSAVRHETGLDINLHCFRHLAAKLYLRKRPGDYETVRLLLGHQSLATTLRSYCDFKQTDAVRRYDAVLNEYTS